MTKLYGSDIENFAIELLEKQGYSYLSPEGQEAGCLSTSGRRNLSDINGKQNAPFSKENSSILWCR